jgi:hypothetical protein
MYITAPSALNVEDQSTTYSTIEEEKTVGLVHVLAPEYGEADYFGQAQQYANYYYNGSTSGPYAAYDGEWRSLL